MDRPSSSFLVFSLAFLLMCRGVPGATFTFVNKCEYTVWPGILANAGSPVLASTGFELPMDSSRTFEAPTGWSGRFWGRTGCTFDGSGLGTCKTGDCGSGQVECNGAGAAPPTTLAEFTLGTGSQDFYDVSLVDGYNLPMLVEGKGGLGTCASTGCLTDLNRRCPAELRVEDGEACKSACEAFGNPEYCCSGAYSTPNTCKPSVYSAIFKSACPRSYSYAYDDASSTFTCTGADYTVTFCPSFSNSQKSSTDSTPTEAGGGGGGGGGGTTIDGSVTYGSGSGSVAVSGSGSESESGSGGSEAVMLANGSWLAGLATGGTTRVFSCSPLQFAATALVIINLILSQFHFSYSFS